MREPQHEPAVEIGWGWPISNDLDLGWIHKHPSFINNVSQILNLGHAKSAFLQIGTQLVLSQCLENLSDVVEVLFPTMVEDQDVIQVYHYK